MSDDVSLTDIANMVGAANSIGGAANDTMDAVSAHAQHIQSLGDFLSADPRGQIFATVFNPVVSTTEQAGVATANAQGGTAVKLGNHVVNVVDTDTKIKEQLDQFYANNQDHTNIALMEKDLGFQSPLSKSTYKGSGKATDENPGLSGQQIDNPLETELGQAAMAARIANGNDTRAVNYAAFKCVDSDGNVFVIAGPSEGMHSERVLGIPALEGGFTITDIYTERQPCNTANNFCRTWLQKYFGSDPPNVTYKWPYTTAEEKKASNIGVTNDAKTVFSDPNYSAPPVSAPDYVDPTASGTPDIGMGDDG